MVNIGALLLLLTCLAWHLIGMCREIRSACNAEERGHLHGPLLLINSLESLTALAEELVWFANDQLEGGEVRLESGGGCLTCLSYSAHVLVEGEGELSWLDLSCLDEVVECGLLVIVCGGAETNSGVDLIEL